MRARDFMGSREWEPDGHLGFAAISPGEIGDERKIDGLTRGRLRVAIEDVGPVRCWRDSALALDGEQLIATLGLKFRVARDRDVEESRAGRKICGFEAVDD